jgi:hypothetical protein
MSPTEITGANSIGPDVLRHREQLRSEEIRLLAGVPKAVALVELNCRQ